MSTSKKFLLAGISVACVVAVAACSKSETPEMVGQKAEEAGETISQKAEDTTEMLSEKTEEAGAAISETSEEAMASMEDAAITAQVKSAILAETGLRLLNVKVETIDGVVTLTGSADSPENIEKAKNLASAVEGVKGVENRLALETAD